MEQQFALSTLAAQVVTQLDLRRKIALQERTAISLRDSESRLKKSESRLQLILDSAASVCGSGCLGRITIRASVPIQLVGRKGVSAS